MHSSSQEYKRQEVYDSSKPLQANFLPKPSIDISGSFVCQEDNGVSLFLLESLLANVKLLDESHFLFDTPKSNPSHLLYGVLSSPADCIPAMLPMLPAVGDVEPICIYLETTNSKQSECKEIS